MDTFKNGSTNYMKAQSVFDNIDKTYEDDATVTGTLKDASDAAITGATNLPMTLVAGTSGRNAIFYAEVPHTVTLPSGTVGKQWVTVTTSSGKVGKFHEAVRFDE